MDKVLLHMYGKPLTGAERCGWFSPCRLGKPTPLPPGELWALKQTEQYTNLTRQKMPPPLIPRP